MVANRQLMSAQRALDRGKSSTALRQAWFGVDEAVREADHESLARALELAEQLVLVTQGRHHADALRLVAYCEAFTSGAVGELRATSLLSRIFRRNSPSGARQKCPECAESIAVGAKVCRFCGYRLDGAGTRDAHGDGAGSDRDL